MVCWGWKLVATAGSGEASGTSSGTAIYQVCTLQQCKLQPGSGSGRHPDFYTALSLPAMGGSLSQGPRFQSYSTQEGSCSPRRSTGRTLHWDPNNCEIPAFRCQTNALPLDQLRSPPPLRGSAPGQVWQALQIPILFPIKHLLNWVLKHQVELRPDSCLDCRVAIPSPSGPGLPTPLHPTFCRSLPPMLVQASLQPWSPLQSQAHFSVTPETLTELVPFSLALPCQSNLSSPLSIRAYGDVPQTPHNLKFYVKISSGVKQGKYLP